MMNSKVSPQNFLPNPTTKKQLQRSVRFEFGKYVYVYKSMHYSLELVDVELSVVEFES